MDVSYETARLEPALRGAGANGLLVVAAFTAESTDNLKIFWPHDQQNMYSLASLNCIWAPQLVQIIL
jgi:hypothetical protein